MGFMSGRSLRRRKCNSIIPDYEYAIRKCYLWSSKRHTVSFCIKCSLHAREHVSKFFGSKEFFGNRTSGTPEYRITILDYGRHRGTIPKNKEPTTLDRFRKIE
jgi:hypothetical protein